MRGRAAVLCGLTLGLVLWALAAMSDPKTGDITFQAAKKGRVVFSHKFHAALEGIPCDYCHVRLKALRDAAGAKKTAFSYMDFCLLCHDGTKAFRTDGNCSRCHESKNPSAHGTDNGEHAGHPHGGKKETDHDGKR